MPPAILRLKSPAHLVRCVRCACVLHGAIVDAFDLLTLGQYLQPTRNHLPVARWVHPTEFKIYREWALDAGFRDVASGPLVRSSYRADELARAVSP